MRSSDRCLFGIGLTLGMLVVPPVAAGERAVGVSPGCFDRTCAIEGRCPAFDWGSVEGAVFYELVIYELPDGFETTLGIELSADHEVQYTRVLGSANGWTPPLERCFIPGGSYVWFVRAVFDEQDVSEAGDWSEGRYFSLAAAPSAQEVEHALEVLRRYAGESGSDLGAVERAAADHRNTGRATRRSGEAGLPGSPKDGERSTLTGPAAIRGEMPDPAGETYGQVGVSNSPDGAGVGAANTAGGADLVLDGSAQGVADAELSESGIDRSSAAAQSFDITNSGAGDMTLRVDGVDVVTSLTDQDTLGGLSCANGELAKWNGSSWECDDDLDTDTLGALGCASGELAKWNGAVWACAPDDDTAPRNAGNQLNLSGNALDVVEGPGSGLDADALDGLDSTAFSPLVHLHDDRYFTETELGMSGAGGAVHWDNLTAVPAGFADGVDDDTTYTFGPGLTIDNGQVVIDPSAFSMRITTLDGAGNVGQHASVAIGADGLGLISYFDDTNDDLKVAHCDDLDCTNATRTTIDSAGSVGQYTSVAIGADGLGLISYYDTTNKDLKVAHCNNVACTNATVTSLDLWTDVGKYTSVAIGTDGLGLISYFDQTYEDLKVAHCHNVTCTGSTLTTLDSAGRVGEHTSVAIGTDGLGLISYYDRTDIALKVAHCSNTACSSATLSTLDGAGDVGTYTSVAIGGDGAALISYVAWSLDDLKVAHCNNWSCTSATVSTLDSVSRTNGQTSVTIGLDGLGLIAYTDYRSGSDIDLKVANCRNEACTSATISTVENTGGDRHNSVAIGADGRGLVAYSDGTNHDLRVAHLPIGF
jgi:hypothetical protein